MFFSAIPGLPADALRLPSVLLPKSSLKNVVERPRFREQCALVANGDQITSRRSRRA
jgi:hypothetical protein